MFVHILCIAHQVGDSSDNIQVPKSSTAHHHMSHNNKRKGTSVHENLNTAELFNLYTMLNDVKVDLLWGRNSEEQPEEKAQQQLLEQQQQLKLRTSDSQQTLKSSSFSAASTSSAPSAKGHVRRPSTASVASSNSTNTLSDTESDISNENDSGIESEPNREVDKATELNRQYRTHLLGLYRCLEQMTEAANYLTNRYQSDIGSV